MDPLYLILLSASILSGIAAAVLVAVRPTTTWAVLLFLTTVGSSLMVKGYGLVDEYLAVCVLAGAFLGQALRWRWPSAASEQTRGLALCHWNLFVLFGIFMILQTFRGILILGDWRILRFSILFATLIGLASTLRQEPDSAKMSERTVTVLLVATGLYFLLYMVHGLWAEHMRSLDRFDRQGDEWSGSTVAMFPFYVATPVALYALRAKRVILGLSVLCISLTAAFFYDSRFSQFAFIAFALIWLARARIEALLLVAIPAAIVISVYSPESDERQTLVESLVTSAPGFVGNPRDSDIGRKVHVIAAVETALEDPVTLLVGTGFYVHRYAMIPHLKQIGARYGDPQDFNEIVRPGTFSAFLVDTGLIGFLLFLANFAITGYRIATQSGSDKFYRALLLATLLVSFLSIFVSLNYDLILFFLTFMPAGLLVRLSGWSPRLTASFSERVMRLLSPGAAPLADRPLTR